MSIAIIPIDPAYLMLFGVLFGVAAVRRRRRALVAGLIATTLFGVGIPAYCYWKFPAWMWGYGVDPATVHPWLVGWVFVLYYIFFIAGFAMTPKRHGIFLLAGMGLLNLALLGIVWGRYGKVGTYDQFHQGIAVDLMGSPLGTILNVGFVATVVGTLALWFWARRGPK